MHYGGCESYVGTLSMMRKRVAARYTEVLRVVVDCQSLLFMAPGGRVILSQRVSCRPRAARAQVGHDSLCTVNARAARAPPNVTDRQAVVRSL